MRRYFENWRAAALAAAAVTAVVLTGMTEGLSLTESFSFYPVMICWLFLTVAAGMTAFGFCRGAAAWPHVNFKAWFLSEKILLAFIVFMCSACALTAAVGVPNTWDSMTYHLPRIEHWIQNKTVGFYPTHILRQLYVTPWSEFAMAHVQILGGGDTGANFIQWSAMAGSLAGVSLIAGQLGANRTGQLMAAVLAACLPMGILESVSTQTDYVCAFWLVVFVFFLIETQRKFDLINIIPAGAGLGLAFLTKGSSYILAIPFLIWFFAANVRKRAYSCLLALPLMLICAVSLNTGQYLRNAQTFGSPAWTHVSYTNEAFDLKVLCENILRNMSIHLGTPLMDINRQLTRTITHACRFWGGDINDPRASFSGDFSIRSTNFDEDYAGNFLHAVLFAVVFVLSWFYRPRGRIGFYVLGVLSSFLLFCLILRYQPWNSRFHLPFFVLFCPVAGVVLEYFFKQRSIFLVTLLFLGAMPWVFLNNQHPWLGANNIWEQHKPAQYFYKRPYLVLPYVAVSVYIKSMGCRQVGLLIGEDTWEYPFWKFLADKDLRIEHAAVNNVSKSLRYPLGDFQACAIIGSGKSQEPFVMAGEALYGPAVSIPAGEDKITVYVRKF